jgi:type I restriction enzyme S subunit
VDTDERFTFQRHIAILRPDLSRILSSYLFYALGTSDIKKQGLVVATGTAQLTIPLGGLRSFVIPLPPVAEQQEIVRRVDQLLAVADGLRQRIDIASTRVDRSSQAVLAKALGGELVPGGTTLDQ